MKHFLALVKLSFLWSILLFVFIVNGQNKRQTSSEFIGLKNTLCKSHQKELKSLSSELKIAKTAIDSAIIFNKISTIHLKTSYYVKTPKYDSILYYAKKSLRLIENDQSVEGIQEHLISLQRIGAMYNILGNNSKSMNYFNDILNITENIPNAFNYYKTREGATTYLALFYANQGKFDLAIKQYQNLFQYMRKNEIKISYISSIVYLYLSRFHRKSGRISTALTYAIKAEKIAFQNDIYFRIAMANFEIAQNKIALNDTQSAYFFLEKGFTLLNDTVEYIVLLSEYYHIKSIIAQQNSNNKERVNNAEKAFALFGKKIVSKKQIELGHFLYESYKEVGDFEKATVILEQINDLEKSLFGIEELKKSALFEIQRRDKNIELAEEKSETLNQIILCIVLLFIVSVMSAIHIYRDRKKKMALSRGIIKQNEALEQLDKAKSQFFSNITHELQTPLTLITGPLEQALSENNEQLDVATKSKLQMAIKNTASLKTLVNDILDLSKLKAKKLTLHSQRTDIDTFLNATMRKFVPLMQQKQLTFHFCFKNLEHVYAIIDTQKLEKVLNNLLSNAIKYTPAKGTISVCGKLNTKDTLIITVKDTGVGISTDDLPFVFDRYFQSKDASKPLEGGYGIGLSLVKELVEFLNGTIDLKSNVTKGSEFTVTLPLKGIDKKTKITYVNSQVSTIKAATDHFTLNLEDIHKTMQQHTILIVEDHRDMQHYIASVLQKNYQLVIVNNGKEALDKLQTTSIDLIVSDVMMPAMDGFTLLETLKESEAYREIPIIMLTALADIKYKLNALTIGVDDYLTKPFIASELLARIQNLLQRYQSRKEFKEEIQAAVRFEDELLENTPENNDIYVDQSVKTSKSDTELIAKVAEIIEKNMDNPDFKLNDLTEKIYLSERQLRRKIKLITGLSPKKFQQEIQLLKARTLLEEDTYRNVKAVAMSLGMQNTTRFSKLYVERFGKHPSSYFTLVS